ncbi:hypothetical protein WJX84_009417 [Apatococcus fuscideae]|uniref:tRNA pseudouridine synthase n=1 Tax=Apatococcus fuscideae TaxID=2026836 RepID=A0AAW1SDL5_9CHLO
MQKSLLRTIQTCSTPGDPAGNRRVGALQFGVFAKPLRQCMSEQVEAIARTGEVTIPCKYLLTLAYKGTTYHGFQAQLQNHAGQQPRTFHTVQEVLEKSLKRVTGSKDRIIISVASRTDAGVHARGQAATFSCTDPKFELQLAALNVTLERNIAVTDILPVSEGFNVAKSLGKLYCYRICDGNVQDPFQQDRQWWVADRLRPAWQGGAALLLSETHQNGPLATQYGMSGTCR